MELCVMLMAEPAGGGGAMARRPHGWLPILKITT